MSRPKSDPLFRHVQSFFQEYLVRTCGASQHTILAYQTTLRLFFTYLASSMKRPVTALSVTHITKKRVLGFLHYLEVERSNSVSTRNTRFSCIKSFVHHLIRRDCTRAAQYQKVLSMPQKKQSIPTICYVEPEEMQVILRQPDQRTKNGVRDYTLMLLLYNTGARISEALAVKPTDLQLRRPYQVQLFGKGRKQRICPIWPMTAATIKRHLGRWDAGPNEPLFHNVRGEPLGRDGAAYILNKHVASAASTAKTLKRKNVTPHALRHGCAIALLQAGVDLAMIRDYLGHESIATTGRYTKTNLRMKRKVLDAFWDEAGLSRPKAVRWAPKAEVLAFLASL